MSSVAFERPGYWMRIAEVGGLVLSCALLFVVVPWDGESLAKAMKQADRQQQQRNTK